MSIWDGIEQKISEKLEQPFRLINHVSVGGGSINEACRIEGQVSADKSLSFFIKLNTKNRLDMFEAEVDGLQEIVKSGAIRVPQVICSGIEANKSYLILENLVFGSGRSDSVIRFGQQLAHMHQTTATEFGWSRDNTIGSTKQINDSSSNWLDFLRDQRFGFQFDLAKQNGAGRTLLVKGEKLLAELEQFFTGYEVEASLLHGDLWSGNYRFLECGDPVIFDPAVYYGDRETDMAMTELFGGFPGDFYSAYNEVWPLHEGYKRRKTLYNLYHILNHFNIFGGGYEQQAENMLDRLLSGL